jgi:hypothetical protein
MVEYDIVDWDGYSFLKNNDIRKVLLKLLRPGSVIVMVVRLVRDVVVRNDDDAEEEE